MAVVKGNILTAGLRGSLGDQLTFYKARTGKTVAQTKIRRNRSSTLKQRAQRAAFKQASIWAQAQEGEFNANMQFYFTQTFGQAELDQAVFI